MRRNSKNDPYMNAMRKALSDTTPVPATMSREEIEKQIGLISERLRGSLNNVERLDLVEARQGLRKQLASTDAALSRARGNAA